MFLIAQLADVKTCDREGLTPLLKSATQKDIDLVLVLLDAGANVNACDKHGSSPLSDAAAEKH